MMPWLRFGSFQLRGLVRSMAAPEVALRAPIHPSPTTLVDDSHALGIRAYSCCGGSKPKPPTSSKPTPKAKEEKKAKTTAGGKKKKCPPKKEEKKEEPKKKCEKKKYSPKCR